jgi:hypothetical protein
MAAQARIVFFPWIWNPKAAPLDLLPSAPSKWATRASGNRDIAPRRMVTGLFGWRVIGANNRELGRGANPAGSVQEAYRAVRAAQLTFGRQAAGVMPHTGGSWSWHLSLDDVRVAESSRGYLRQRECDYSLEHFHALFPTAEVLELPSNLFRSSRSPVSGALGLRTDSAGRALAEPTLVTT